MAAGAYNLLGVVGHFRPTSRPPLIGKEVRARTYYPQFKHEVKSIRVCVPPLALKALFLPTFQSSSLNPPNAPAIDRHVSGHLKKSREAPVKQYSDVSKLRTQQ